MPAASQHRVKLLPGLLPGHQAVHGVGGDALGTVNSGGIAETGRLAHLINRQLDGQLAAVVPDGEVTAPADAGDGPPVAILNPLHPIRVMHGARQHGEARRVTDQLGMSTCVYLRCSLRPKPKDQ